MDNKKNDKYYAEKAIEQIDIIGFRNGIVHEYGKTDYKTVYETITQDINELKEVLKLIQ